MKHLLSVLAITIVVTAGFAMIEDFTVPNAEGHTILEWDIDFGLLSQQSQAAPNLGCLAWESCRMNCHNNPDDSSCSGAGDRICCVWPDQWVPAQFCTEWGSCARSECLRECLQECDMIPHGGC